MIIMVIFLQRSCILFASTTPQDKPICRVNFIHLFQEPTLFSGSLRFNLDPGNHFSDEALHRAIHSAGLTELVLVSSCVLLRVLVPIFSLLPPLMFLTRLRNCQEGWSTRCLKEEQA